MELADRHRASALCGSASPAPVPASEAGGVSVGGLSPILHCGDCIEVMRAMPDGSVDLVFGSPPYGNKQRDYGIGYDTKDEAWVAWMLDVFREASRVSRGLVAMVVQGANSRPYRWSATPALLMADLHRAGFNLRMPPLYRRWGVAGTGGRDWLRIMYEFVVCVTPPGRLPWSDPTAFGHPPKYPPGGRPSSRNRKGERVRTNYKPPERCNPGNIIDCGAGGGTGFLGHRLAKENEAPFALKLAEFFVRSYCPPGGVVLDPFVGSGTTLHAAAIHGRKGVGIDCRKSQLDLTRRRLAESSVVVRL